MTDKERELKLFLSGFPGGRLRLVEVLGPNEMMGEGFTYIRYLDTNGTDTTTDEFLYDIPGRSLLNAWNQRNDGWILASDRLPKENAHEPIIVSNGKITGIAYYFAPRPSRDTPEWRYDDDYYLKEIAQNVIKWQPLPQD